MRNLKLFVGKRYFVFLCITLLVFFIPFVQINQSHFFLLSFDKKELHLFFNTFSTQELYLMPFVLIFFFLFIFFITTLAGRIWCGWACPQTIFRSFFRDFIQTKLLKIRKSSANKQQKTQNGIKNLFAILIWAFICIIIASNFLWYFIPPEDFFKYLKNPDEHKLLVGILFGISAFLFIDIAFIAEKFCIYVCPYARIQSVMFDNDTIHVIYNEKRGGSVYDGHGNLISNKPQNGECIGCNACVKICPTHIDIRKGMQLECINCLECSDACSNIMSKFNKKTLIEWSSKNAVENDKKVKFARFRTIGYVVVLSIVFVALLFMSTKKENVLLNINRATELYSIDFKKDITEVKNDYVFLLENTDKKDHMYYFDVNNTNIKIQRPTKPIKVIAGQKQKIIVRLITTNRLADEDRKDTIIPIEIKIYATDDKVNINAKRDTIFIYPKNSVLKDKSIKK